MKRSKSFKTPFKKNPISDPILISPQTSLDTVNTGVLKALTNKISFDDLEDSFQEKPASKLIKSGNHKYTAFRSKNGVAESKAAYSSFVTASQVHLTKSDENGDKDPKSNAHDGLKGARINDRIFKHNKKEQVIEISDSNSSGNEMEEKITEILESLQLEKRAARVKKGEEWKLDTKQTKLAKLDISRPLLIVAGAGSGKTSTLCARVKYLVKMGVQPNKILVLTFSNKAAGELKQRIEMDAKNTDTMPHQGVNTTNVTPLKPIISTFHAFCYQLVFRYYEVLGFKTKPMVISTKAQSIKALERGIYRIYNLKLLRLFEKELARVDVKLPKLEKLVTVTEKNDAKVVKGKEVKQEQTEQSLVNQLWKQIEKATKIKIDTNLVKTDKELFEKHIEMYMEFTRRAHRPIDNLDQSKLSKMYDFVQKARAKGQKANEFLEDQKQWMESYQWGKRSLGLVDFDDMLSYGNQLLEVKGILKKVCKQMEYMLVDEFQDLNKLQMQIIMALQKSKGNVTVVGDERQSIYGFRGAAPDHNFQVFLDHFVDGNDVGISNNKPVKPLLAFYKKKGIKESSFQSLDTNYRSKALLVDLGNLVMDTTNLDNKLLSRLRVSVTASPENKTNDRDTNSAFLWRFRDEFQEADSIARCVKHLITKGGYRGGEIAILMRNLRFGPLILTKNLQNALALQGIKYVVRGGQSLVSSRKWLGLANYLRAVCLKEDSEAMKSCIEDFVAGVGPATLKRISDLEGSVAKEFFTNERSAEDSRPVIVGFEQCLDFAIKTSVVKGKTRQSLQEFLEQVYNLRGQIGKSSLSEFICSVYDTIKPFYIIPTTERNDNSNDNNNSAKKDENLSAEIQNLDFHKDFLVSILKGFSTFTADSSHPDQSLSENVENTDEYHFNCVSIDSTSIATRPVILSFVAHLSMLSDSSLTNDIGPPDQSDSQSGTSNVHNDARDTVIISTIHQAKGLEWPVVFLPLFIESLIPRLPTQASLQLSNDPYQNTNPDIIKAKLHHHFEEEKRLAYVAITRAKEKVFISYPHTTKDACFLPRSGFGFGFRNGNPVFASSKAVVDFDYYEDVLCGNDGAEPFSLNHTILSRFIPQNLRANGGKISEYGDLHFVKF